MKLAVRYFTRSGNTAKLAESIASAVGVSAKTVAVPIEERVDILFLGSSVYAGGVDDAVKMFIEQNSNKIGCIVNFSTAALVRSTYKQVKKLAEQNGIAMAKDEYYCRGAFSVMHRSRPNGEDLKKAAQFAKDITKQFIEKQK